MCVAPWRTVGLLWTTNSDQPYPLDGHDLDSWIGKKFIINKLVVHVGKRVTIDGNGLIKIIRPQVMVQRVSVNFYLELMDYFSLNYGFYCNFYHTTAVMTYEVLILLVMNMFCHVQNLDEVDEHGNHEFLYKLNNFKGEIVSSRHNFKVKSCPQEIWL